MGVKGLWQLLRPAGKPISLESLDGKVLAVDVSIWLNKAAKGMRDKQGYQVYNAHLVLMLHRICKLLFYGIKPVFVFDGGVPELKKNTLKARRKRRRSAETTKAKTKDVMLSNYLQAKALEVVTGVKSNVKLKLNEDQEPDLFQLEPLADVVYESTESSSDDDMEKEENWLKVLREEHIQEMFQAPEGVDLDSDQFKTLPAEIKHELLVEVKDAQRRRYRRKEQQHVSLPEDAGQFSKYQLHNLKKRGLITQQIDSLRKEMNSSIPEHLLEVFEEKDLKKTAHQHIESKRMASDSRAGYVLIKTTKSRDENILFKTSLDDDYIRFKKRESDFIADQEYQRLERVPARFQATKNERVIGVKFFSDDSSDEDKSKAIASSSSMPPAEVKKDEVEYMSTDSDDSDDVVVAKPDDVFENSMMKLDSAEDTTEKDDRPEDNSILITSEDTAEHNTQTLNVINQKSHVDSELEPPIVGDDQQENNILEIDKHPVQIEHENPDMQKEVSPSPQIAGRDDNSKFLHEATQHLNKSSIKELKNMQEHLVQVQSTLTEVAQKQTRQAATLTSEKYKEVQELLQLFGIPYLVSPMEAEAQCAQLDYSNLTDGSVTDDSDVFLFGGKNVYKNVFNQKKYVEFYQANYIERVLLLTRRMLIAIAFLTGSDYTEGIQGVGGVSAMEILHEFNISLNCDPEETLRNLRKWLMDNKSGKCTFTPGSKLGPKLKRATLPSTFNSPDVWEAYLEPTVDQSDERFEWGPPDIDAIKEFANEKLGWPGSRTDEIILPVLQKLKEKMKSQKTLDKYFPPNLKTEKSAIYSKRLRRILELMGNSDKRNSDTYEVNIVVEPSKGGTPEKLTSSSATSKSPRKQKSGKPSTSDETASSYFPKNLNEPVNTKTDRAILKRRISSEISCTVSSNEKVQAIKMENLAKAAEARAKPVPPYIRVQKINNAIQKRLQNRGGKRVRNTTKKSKLKAAANQVVNVERPKPLVSSESDSD